MIYHDGKPVREVVLHCAAIKTGQFQGVAPAVVRSVIDRWHRQRGFNGFGYHGLIVPDGRFIAGRALDRRGAHVSGHNSQTWGLLLIETREVTRVGRFEDWFTEEQREAVKLFLRPWPQIEKVSGHNDYAAKLCPGFKVQSKDWL